MVLGIGTRARTETSRLTVPLKDFSEGRDRMGAESYQDSVRLVKRRVRGLKVSARVKGDQVEFTLEGDADQIAAGRKQFGLDD